MYNLRKIWYHIQAELLFITLDKNNFKMKQGKQKNTIQSLIFLGVCYCALVIIIQNKHVLKSWSEIKLFHVKIWIKLSLMSENFHLKYIDIWKSKTEESLKYRVEINKTS